MKDIIFVLVLVLAPVYGDKVANAVNKLSDDVVNHLTYDSPNTDPTKFYFADHFNDKDNFAIKWITSNAKKDDLTKYDGRWDVELPKRPLLKNDFGMVLKSKAKHAAISSSLNRHFVFSDKPLVLQYEVNMQEGQECGGSYVKLLSSGKDTTDLKEFRDNTPYTIMFGPDKCGSDIKLHFIFRHLNPINGTITEKHCRNSKERLDEPFKDKQPHLYQLVVRPDNTYHVRFDHKIINEGSLLTDFLPPVNPPKEIDDPQDKKPMDWDEREKIADPDARKPDDWNEDEPPQIVDPNASIPDGWLNDVEEMIPDPKAVKPIDWEDEMDGDWEAPLITNPACAKAIGCGSWKAPMISNPNHKGKWRAPLIDNPNYRGIWTPRKIPNPDFFEDTNPFNMTTISAVGIELWSMSSDILFDNIILTDDEEVAKEWAAQTYDLKRKIIDREAESLVSRILNFVNENPWIWAVLIVVVGLPLAIFAYFACSSKISSASARAKKTGEFVPNSEEQNEHEMKRHRNSTSDDGQRKSVEGLKNDEDDGCDNVKKEKYIVEDKEDHKASKDKSNDSDMGIKKRKPRKD